MFIKKSLKTDSKNGKAYTAYHLVESVRTERGPRQRVLLYMGSEIDLPEEELKSLAQRIEEKKYTQELLDRGIKRILYLALAFEGKKVLIRSKTTP